MKPSMKWQRAYETLIAIGMSNEDILRLMAQSGPGRQSALYAELEKRHMMYDRMRQMWREHRKHHTRRVAPTARGTVAMVSENADASRVTADLLAALDLVGARYNTPELSGNIGKDGNTRIVIRFTIGGKNGK